MQTWKDLSPQCFISRFTVSSYSFMGMITILIARPKSFEHFTCSPNYGCYRWSYVENDPLASEEMPLENVSFWDPCFPISYFLVNIEYAPNLIHQLPAIVFEKVTFRLLSLINAEICKADLCKERSTYNQYLKRNERPSY